MIVIATLLPSNGVTGSTSLWCMVCGPRWLADVISNVALFVPLGVALSLVGLRLRHALVVSASLSTAATIESLGRFSTHSPVRTRFCDVFECVASPSMQRQPSQKADDIGARLLVPSSLIVLIRTTGVPK